MEGEPRVYVRRGESEGAESLEQVVRSTKMGARPAGQV